MKRAKIVATLGPSSSNEIMIKKLMTTGVNVFRLNFSHGNHAEHKNTIKNIRMLSQKMEKSVAILGDLQGPKLRVGELKQGKSVQLKRGQLFTITTHPIKGTNTKISTSYQHLPTDVKKGSTILINDGLLSMTVIRTTKTDVICKVVTGGILEEHKGINLPSVPIRAPSLTPKDKKDLQFCLSQDLDYIALSFVREASDVKILKKLIAKAKKNTQVIAKIEKPQAVANIDAIIKAADGIMIARGDLGVEMKAEEVPIVQKRLIEKAAMNHKIVITATQMLESMIHNPTPTRAEASDVSNAIMDGTDATMLSGETATGKYPVQSVKTMSDIAITAEKSPYMRHFNNIYDPDCVNITLATVSAAHSAIIESKAKAILVFTVSGSTALLISKLRPQVPIIAATPLTSTYRRLALLWGVTPIITRFFSSSKKLLDEGKRLAIKKKLIKENDTIIVIIGEGSQTGSSNVMKIL